MSNKRYTSMNAFLAESRNFARPSKYRVEFRLPSGVSGASVQDLINDEALAYNIKRNETDLINILCQSVSMPMRSLMTYEVKHNSAPVKYPYTANYDPVTISFYADMEFITRRYLELWQECTTNVESNTFNFPSEYTSDFTIITLDTQGNDVYSVTLKDAWVINIGMVDNSYSATNTAQIITATFAYKRWSSKYIRSQWGNNQE